MLQQIFEFLENDSKNAVERLRRLLAIPSVSTDPAPHYREGIQQGAQWVAQTLRELGLETQIHPTAGHPVVLGRGGPKGKGGEDQQAAVLFYGHYDVQPPDPLEDWTTGPFEPTVRDGAIYARGASDDKGQVCCFLEALRAWKQVNGELPVPVIVLIEGEEECGGPHLKAFVEQHAQDLKADFALVSDTKMWDTPAGPKVAITYGLRGMVYFDVQLHHSNRDLHSGGYGGSLANPACELTAVLGRLFDADHRVTIPGFYDDVVPVTQEESQRWSKLVWDEPALFKAVGVTHLHGESGFTTLQRLWARPACDINGLYGGYGGAGAKTIIPAFAGAKVSFRLAPNQQPGKIAQAFRQWLESQNVHGCRWKITELSRADPVVLPVDSPHLAASQRAVERSAGCLPVMVREGATIPVVADFKRALGINTVLIGFGLSDDRIHAPNEKFNLDCFALGCKTHAALLGELAAMK